MDDSITCWFTFHVTDGGILQQLITTTCHTATEPRETHTTKLIITCYAISIEVFITINLLYLLHTWTQTTEFQTGVRLKKTLVKCLKDISYEVCLT